MQITDWITTKLGHHIWEKKYKYDENETFDQWLDRISGGNKNIRQLIVEKKFLFGGRILANRGLQNKGRKVTFSNCFLPNQKVLTDKGYKNIQDICIGDKVLTHANKYQTVNAALQREYDGEIYIITPRYGLGDIKCTPNHEFFTNRGWVRADNLKEKSAEIKTINNDYYTQIKSIKKEYYQGKVYNLSVEVDNSYNINGLIVHNCYVITPPEDNIESIFDCAKKLARTYSYGGGCGTDISKLAPRGAKINNAARETTGSVSFMDLYSLVTDLIGQCGRRGALMLSIDCTHPDLEEFIKVKSDLNKVTKANISVRINDDFIKAIKENKDWELVYTRKETNETIKKVVNARQLFRKLAEINWDYAEPGLINWSRVCNWSLLSDFGNFEFAGLNPCGEQTLPAGGSCLLGSINLSEFVLYPFTSKATFDFEGFNYAVEQGVIALNEVLHEGLPLHPLEEQRESVNNWRQIGLGIFGLHDALIKLGIRYGSKKSLDLVDKIGVDMINTALITSAHLTKVYDKFPMYDEESLFKSKFFQTNAREKTKEIIKEYGLANSQLLTIAPTGSTATMLSVSTGIEPIYSVSYTRKTESLHGEDKYYKIYTPIIAEYMEIKGIKEDKDLPSFINCALTLNYKERITMQAIWQKYIDASISSTINVPSYFTVEEVEDLYLLAWEKGLKGVTLYRSGCKRDAILSEDNKVTYKEIPRGFIETVPEDLVYRKYKLKTGCGNLYFFVGIDEGDNKVYDCFTNTGGVGGCPTNTQANSRLLSACLRGGVPLEYIIQQLEKAGACPSYQYKRGKGEKLSKGKSCASAIANVLKKILEEFAENEKEEEINKCPECGVELIFQGGCTTCNNCGFSRCE